MTRKDDSRIIRIVHPICCGLDVHKESVSACVLFPDSNGEEQCEVRVSDVSSCDILAEIGPTLDSFPTDTALVSWSGLCPGNNESAGKRKSGKSPVRMHRLKTIMLEVAWAAVVGGQEEGLLLQGQVLLVRK